MTQLNDKEHAAQMADMASFDEEMPSIGIFWYDPQDNTLFGVRKKELTPQMVEDAAEKGVRYIDYSEEWAKAASEREENQSDLSYPEREQSQAKLKEYFRRCAIPEQCSNESRLTI